MERNCVEGVCVDNSVVAGLLAEVFQGVAPDGARFTKADELTKEKLARRNVVDHLFSRQSRGL